MRRIAILSAIGAILLTGCATRPEDISSSYISPLQYSVYNCDQLRMELFRVSNRVREITGVQRRQANNDAVMVGAAVVFWPTVFLTSWGRDKKEELASLKGQYDALSDASIEKNCPVAEELKATARQAGMTAEKPIQNAH